MKLIIQDGHIVATATDAYTGPDPYITAPPEFDLTRMSDYRVIDGQLTLPSSRQLTRLQFRNRFTPMERATLEMAALDDPAAITEQRMRAAMLRAYLADLAAAEYIDLDDPATISGVRMLEDASLLAAGRADAILDIEEHAEGGDGDGEPT